jgi:hypothetical protein
MSITSKYKREVGKCEQCGSSNKLQAAHVSGKGRLVLIGIVLREYTEGNIIKVDLSEFEQKFNLIHLPLQETIKILCHKCHQVYDQTSNNFPINGGERLQEETQEVNIVPQLISKELDKVRAMLLLTSKHHPVNAKNTTYSNIVQHKGDCWWFQISNDKFKSDFYFVLHNDKSKQLFVLKVPANTIKTPETYFNQRNDKYRKETSNIYIPTSGTSFKEKNGFDFSRFLVEKIDY